MFKGILKSVSIALLACFVSFSALAAKINVNTADVEMLAAGLNGVGPTIAQRIIEYREANGPFTSIEHLMEVRGIGEAILEKNLEELSIEASSN
jgi:competence protein ComEA